MPPTWWRRASVARKRAADHARYQAAAQERYQAAWAGAQREAERLLDGAGGRMRRSTRNIANARARILAGFAPIICYAQAALPNARPQTLFGLTYTLEGDLGDDAVITNDGGDVAAESVLYECLNHLETLKDAGVGEPRAQFDAFVEDDQTPMLWEAIRAAVRPGTIGTTMTGGGSHESSSLNFDVPTVGPSGRSLAEILTDLDATTGLSQVKSFARELAATAQMDVLRAANGFPVASQTRHLVFTGNPGTGKTTVARVVADILHASGAMPGAQLVETDRAGLVGEFLGSSALKTRKMIDCALGGVLFIDEAYSLAGNEDSHGDRFAQEALDTLVKAMEDDRDDLVVILAGYPEEMTRLISMNTGLASRIGQHLHFSDYSDQELVTIFTSMATAAGMTLAPDALQPIRQAVAAAERGRAFGNARYARSLFEATMRAHALRLLGDGDAADDGVEVAELSTIRLADTVAAARRGIR